MAHTIFNKTNTKPKHDVIYVDTFNLLYLRRIFVNPKCGLSGDFSANHVRLTVIKVCSPWKAFLLPSPSQREHRLYLWLSENILRSRRGDRVDYARYARRVPTNFVSER